MEWNFEHQGVSYALRSSPIADSSQISICENMSGVRPLPDMFFPGSQLCIKIGDASFEFSPVSAISCSRIVPPSQLATWNKLNPPSLIDAHVREEFLGNLKVKQADSWASSRTIRGVRELVYDHDWTFTSTYWGELTSMDPFSHTYTIQDPSDDFLPLKTISDSTVPLQAYKELHFWEDELDDSGCSKMGLRLRVTDLYFYVLLRFELLLDSVLASRSLETRVYHRLGSDEIMREFKWIEDGKELKELRSQQIIRLKG